MNKEGHEFELDFRKFFNIFRHNILWLLLAVVVFGGVAGVFTEFFIDKTYSTSVNFYVYSDAQESGGSVTSSQLSAADTHAYSAMDILSTKECQKTMGVIDKNVEVSSKKKSSAPIFTVVVSGVDRELVCSIAENIKNDLPDYVYSITRIGKLTSYGFTGLDNEADSPNIIQNVIISGFVGFVLAFIIFLLRFMLDTGIHDEADVKNLFDYPILGSVPMMMGDGDGEKNQRKRK